MLSKSKFYYKFSMSKYRGPRLRIIRRLGELPAFTRKAPKRFVNPGQHGANRSKPTQFAYRLVEKQKLRFYYGISEKQAVHYVKAAQREKGPTGQILIRSLEIRLDNIVYRLGWAPTLPSARQIVNHGHILVDQKRVTIPSFSCSQNQVIAVKNDSSVRSLVEKTFRDQDQSPPSHLSLNTKRISAIVNRQADPRELPLDLNELLVVEFYSNRL
jgi:small subunit ribosomal protein S4